MHDCAKDVLKYHDDEVTLSQKLRSDMRARRDANRDRVKKGLKAAKQPSPIEFVSQGSYAMKTMVQHPDNEYDLDDGVYFEKKDLKGSRGAEMSALDVRQMVRDAVDDGSFKTKPEVRKNCVTVYYDAGYHVDLPVYRRVEKEAFFGDHEIYYELASADWKRSDARDVTEWFEKENEAKSPDKENGRQLRRIVRLLKKLAKSRPTWASSILSGFGITVLVVECFKGNAEREDVAFYETMKAIRDRLEWNLEVKHPVTPGETIASGSDDAKAKYLLERLKDVLGWLKPLRDEDCSREKGLKCWDKVFSTEFFSKRYEAEVTKSDSSGGSLLTAGIIKEAGASEEAQAAVRKEGGGRYA
jgi:hypothetical protein